VAPNLKYIRNNNMKIKNKTTRNINMISSKNKKMVSLIGNSTLELDDADYLGVQENIHNLEKEGIIEILVSAETNLSNKEIISKVLEETGVKLPDKSTKKELQDRAEMLDVNVKPTDIMNENAEREIETVNITNDDVGSVDDLLGG